MKQIHVVAAAIRMGDRYLCVQKGKTKYEYTSFRYEFPGGKVEPDETPQQALERELMEELDCRVKTERLLVTVNHAYPDFEITMDVFLCHAPEGEFNFKEHVNHVWLKADELSRLDWAAADFKALPYIKDE